MNIDNVLIVFGVVIIIIGLFRIAYGRPKREVWLVMGRDCKKNMLYVAGVFYLERDLLNSPLGDEKIALGKRRFFINGEMTTIDVRVE